MTNNQGYVRLFKNHKQTVGYWEGWVEDNVVIMQYATGMDHSVQRFIEAVSSGKQGRSVNEQALFRLRSRVNNKLDNGYVATMAEASNSVNVTDAKGRIKPMLASKFKDYKGTIDEETTYVQLKFNGHRCLLMNVDGETKAFSRNGKEIPGVKHITNEVQLEQDQILDGEVYHHGWKLQHIASAAKKQQPDSLKLKFMCFDAVDANRFAVRKEIAAKILSDVDPAIAGMVLSRKLSDIYNLKDTLIQAIMYGYEGLILRLDNAPYEIGRRSRNLLKLKQMLDAEFKVIDIISSKDQWAILVLETEDGKVFKASAPGKIQDKTLVLMHKESYVGKYVTVEYPEYTAAGIPFQPVATQWRMDL